MYSLIKDVSSYNIIWLCDDANKALHEIESLKKIKKEKKKKKKGGNVSVFCVVWIEYLIMLEPLFMIHCSIIVLQIDLKNSNTVHT